MRFLLTLTAAGIFLAVFAFAAGEVEIPNGDFEDYSGGQFDGWTAVGITGGNPVLEEFDTCDGYGAFYVDESTSGNHYLQRTISGLIPDETYLLTAKVKTKGVNSSSCGAAVKLGNSIVIGGCDTTQPVTGTREWTLIQVAFRATDDECQINVGLFGASGKAWFDDVLIIRINGLLKNPDLERGTVPVGGGWSPSDWTTGAGNAAYESADPLTGERSLKVNAPGGNNYKYQTLEVMGGEVTGFLRSFRDYTYKAYVKTENVLGNGVYVRVNKDGNGENLDSIKVTGTEDWTELNVGFTPVLLNDYEFRLAVEGSGTAYFDRVRLERHVISDPGFDLGLYDPEHPGQLGAEPWEKDLQYEENVVEVVDEGGNKILKVYYHGTREDFYPPRGYQEVELFKGCDYRITWRGRAGIDAGAYVAVTAGNTELYKRGFNTGPSFADFEDFFYVPPEALGVSDSYNAEVTLSLENDGNTVYFDDVFIEKVSERQDVNPVTVIPQPQAVVDLGFDTEPIKSDLQPGFDWKIYVTRTGSVTPPPPASWGDIADRLDDDLASEFDVGPLTWSNLESPVLRPAIVIGDVDGTNQYFLDLIDDLGGVSDYVTSNDEGYEMFIDRDLIVIAASEPAGAFYGTQTLLQYLKEVPTRYDPEEHLTNRVGYVPCGHIYDWPDMQVRGTVVQIFSQINIGNDYAGYQAKLGKLNLESWKVYRDWIRFLASMKVNALLIAAEYPTLGINPFTEEPYTSTRPGNFPVGTGGIINNRDALTWFFDECRGNFIEPIPNFGPMGHAQSQCLLYEPYAVEARYVGGWPMLLEHEEETVPQPPDVITNVTDGTWNHLVSNDFVIKREDADEFGSPTAFFKVEKWEDGQWKPATYLPWNTQGPADLSYEFIDLWFDGDYGDRVYGLTKEKWQAEDDDVEDDRNLRFKARDYDEPNGSIRVYYNHVWPYCYKYDDEEGHSKEDYRDYSYCPEDEDVQAFLEDTIDDIFHYLGPIGYINIFHDEIHRMRTCSKCYDTEIEYHGGKKVTECGVLLADDINRYYNWIEDAADTYQGGVQPYIIIHGDSIIWGHTAISFGPKPGDVFDEGEKKRWEHRNKYRNHFGFLVEEWPDNGNDVNDLGLDSWRWKLGEMPRLVIRPWDYSINMMNVDGGIDVVPKWTMTTYAREVLEGMPVPDYGGYSPPYWPEPYPQYKMLGTPSLAPERFTNYDRGPSKTTDNYFGRAGVYAALRLFNDQDELISAATGIDDSEQESRIKALQAIEGSLWRHVPGYTDEWGIPPGETEQEDWYYVERDFGKFTSNFLKNDYTVDDIDYATFRVQFDSLVYDKPVTNPENPILFDPGAGGKVWFDDAEFKWTVDEWVHSYDVNNFDNWYFNTEGTGSDAFEDWTLKAYREGNLQPYPPLEADEYAETRVFRKPPPGEEWRGYKSCSINRYKTVKDDMNYYVALEQDVDDFGLYDFVNTKFRVGLRVRSKYVDTYRLAGVWQWQYVLDRYDYNKYDPDRERALGIILHNGFQRVFYNRPNDLPENPGDWPDGDALDDDHYDFAHRHGWHYSVNGRACEAAVAEWCWSLNKPRKWDNPMSINTDEGIYDTPKLENLWYCPYYIYQRERTWFEKK